MKTLRYYNLILPLQDTYEDDGTEVIVEIPVEGDKYRYALALIGKEKVPELIRVTVSDLPDETQEDTIPDNCIEIIHLLIEHSLTIMHLFYDKHLICMARPIWVYSELPSLSMSTSISAPTSRPMLDGPSFENVFNASFEVNHLVRLFSEGIDGNLPRYYRLVSLYRILEIVYKQNDRWQQPYYDLLQTHEASIKQAVPDKTNMMGYIEELRNKCAHGKFIYKKVDRQGIIQIDRQGLKEVEVFLPIITQLATSAINTHVVKLNENCDPESRNTFILGTSSNPLNDQSASKGGRS